MVRVRVRLMFRVSQLRLVLGLSLGLALVRA